MTSIILGLIGLLMAGAWWLLNICLAYIAADRTAEAVTTYRVRRDQRGRLPRRIHALIAPARATREA